jgi:hypothetical protein
VILGGRKTPEDERRKFWEFFADHDTKSGQEVESHRESHEAERRRTTSNIASVSPIEGSVIKPYKTRGLAHHR